MGIRVNLSIYMGEMINKKEFKSGNMQENKVW